jgi:outer membrane protein
MDSRASAAGFDNSHVSNSWGWAAQVGADYMLTDRLMLKAQMRYIETDAYVSNTNLGVRSKVNVDVDPFVYMVGLGYKF